MIIAKNNSTKYYHHYDLQTFFQQLNKLLMTKKACGRLLHQITSCKLVLFRDICSWKPDYPK